MKSRYLLLGLFAALILIALALWVYVDQAAADDPIAQRLAILKQRGVKVQTTPRSAPLPPGVTVLPTPPPVDDDALRPPASQRSPLSPRVSGQCKNDPDLFTYIAQRTEALNRVEPFGPKGVFPARVSFKRPISDADLERLVRDYHLYPANLTYVTNSDAGGNFCYGCDTLAGTETRLRTQYDDRMRVAGYSSMETDATPQDLRRLTTHPDVLLVDTGTLEQMEPGKYRARYPDPVFWRYEQACH